MTNDADELGRSITAAVRFLREIYKDIHQMLIALDGLMADRGWQPTERSRISYQLSNSSADPASWVLEYLFRFYAPSEAAGSFQSVAAFVVRCAPPAPFDQPVVLGAVADFSTPTDWVTVYNQWRCSEPTLHTLATTPGPRLLAAEECQEFIPGASRVVGMAVHLCRLDGTHGLRDCLVEPLLKAFQPQAG